MEMYVNYNVKNGFVPILCPDGLCPLAARNGGQLSENEVCLMLPTSFKLFLIDCFYRSESLFHLFSLFSHDSYLVEVNLKMFLKMFKMTSCLSRSCHQP